MNNSSTPGMGMGMSMGGGSTMTMPGHGHGHTDKNMNMDKNMKMDKNMNMDKNMKMDMGMSMTFHTGYVETILFPGVKTQNTAEIIGASVIVFCVALLYEGLKVLREEIIEHYQKKKKCDEEPEIKKISIFIWPHILQTFLHIIQMVISYFLMLIFMTYNVWLCLAVALGAGAGYFAFRWKRPFNALEASEHCH